MSDVIQNTLYLTTPATFVARDHLTLQVEVPVYPPELPPEERTREHATDWRKLSIPIHHLESVCTFGPRITLTAPALDLCWEHGVSVNYLSEGGYLQARVTGVADTSVTLRRAHFRAADLPAKCAAVARQIIAGKIQNSRNSLLRAARETEMRGGTIEPVTAVDGRDGAADCRSLGRLTAERSRARTGALDALRGSEGLAGQQYFGVFRFFLKQQRENFGFATRSRRPPRDRINCLLSVSSTRSCGTTASRR